MPAHSVIWLYLVDALHAPIDPIYNAAVKREIDKIAASIPHDELAIQFDVASAVFARLERNQASSYGRTKAGDAGDLQQHPDRSRQPRAGRHRSAVSTSATATSTTSTWSSRPTWATWSSSPIASAREIERPIQLIHMPVPRNRADDAYFEPLRRLELRPETELCLGLVHHTDGVEGTKRRLATARKYVADFSVGTECGFGRRDPRTIPELLRIHAQVAELD